MFSPRRAGPVRVRFLEWRIRIFGAGAVLGLVGIFLEASWLVTVAVVVLVAGVALKLMPDEDSLDEEEEPDI